MNNRMNICHVDLWHAQTTKTARNKTKTIQEYLGGSSVQKRTCLRQLESSLQLGLMREYFCMLYAQRVEFVWNEGGVV